MIYDKVGFISDLLDCFQTKTSINTNHLKNRSNKSNEDYVDR